MLVAEPLPVRVRVDESLDHLGADEVAAEGVELRVPEPEPPPVALTAKRGSPKVLSPSAPNVIVWSSFLSVRLKEVESGPPLAPAVTL